MTRILAALALCAWATLANAAVPTGVFILYNPGDQISAAAAGVTLTVNWSAIEPSPGVFNWSAIDDGIKAAGTRQVKLGIQGGVFSPAWVYAGGAASISETWAWKWGFPLCSVQRSPIPWDTTFLADWNRLTAALGARYGSNPQVVAIAHSAIMSKDLENVLPTAAPTSCPHSINPQEAWLAAGYTPDLILGAAAQATAAYVAAFPHATIVLETGSWAFPSTDGKPDWALVKTLAEQFVDDAGAQAMLENDGLTAGSWSYTSPVPDAPLGLQAGALLTGSATCLDNSSVKPCPPLPVMTAMMAKATAMRAPFVELYAPDVDNAALADVLSGWVP